jgi:hypothetical protein
VQNREGITVEIFANQWFLTLYSYNFPLNYVFRIWDLFLSEGIDFILTMALAIFCHQQGAPPFPSISSPPPLPSRAHISHAHVNAAVDVVALHCV